MVRQIKFSVTGFFVPLLFLFITHPGKGQTHFYYNADIRHCYNQIIKLNIGEATLSINKLKQTQGDNGAIIHLENYIDFFVLFITESKEEYSKRLPNKSKRIQQLEASKIKSPYLAFVKAEILLQWALIHFKFDDKLKAANDGYSAYHYLEENKKAYPAFIENNKSLSIIHALAASWPKWLRKIIGVKGSINQGSSEIEAIASHALNEKNYFFREEVACIYTYILYYQLNKKSLAISQLEKFNLDHTTYPLVAFLKASMYLRIGNNEACLNVLNQLEKSPGQLPFYYLDFMKGRSLLYKQDASAKKYLESFVNNFKGLHFIKEAYQKLAWYELSINNDLAAYKKYLYLSTIKGNELVDEDKQALKEARSNQAPNPILLKARILFDGGYYSRSQSTLIKNAYSLSENADTELEFNYRMGRVLQALKNYPDAIIYFKTTITLGANIDHYYAASASLQLAGIYEEQSQIKNARFYYNKCLELNPSEYKNSIHQKAKSGLQRLNGR